MEPFRPRDVYLLSGAGDPRVSPDGERIAFTVTELDEGSNEYRSAVWMAATEEVQLGAGSDRSEAGDTPARRFTSGEHRDSRPRWSPDGRRLAFVSHRTEKLSQLFVMPADGGEPRKVCESPEEIEDPAWSPDGKRIAYTARDRDPEQYEPEKDKDRPARRIDRLVYRLDNVGWIIDRPKHLYVVDVDEEESEPKQLTSGPYHDGGLAWSPDGKNIAFGSARHETWDTDRLSDIFVVPSGGGEPTPLTSTDGSYSHPSWSPDGSMIAYAFTPEPLNGPRHTHIGVIDVESRGTRIVTDALDRNATPQNAGREPMWVGGDIYFTIEESGNVHLYRAPADGKGKPELVLGDDRWIVGFDRAGATLAYVATTPVRLPHLAVLTDEDGRGGRKANRDTPQVLTDPLTTQEIIPPERFTATSKDGTEVEAWVMRPGGFEADTRYPALLNIHGGPFTQYGNRFFDEFQVYAGAGYAVVYSNPRGSSGYPEAWGRAIRGRNAPGDPGSGWGGVDFEDLMAVTDEAVRRFPFIDPDRLGVLGGSYGGYMTSWMVGHTDRFRAACSERALNSHLTFAFTSDIGPVFRSYFGPTYLEDPEEYARMSPITYVDDIETPLLIVHSEGDLRCPISQAEELFFAMRLKGKDVEFVRFPGEGHELSRSGAPKHRVERFEIILDFFDRHLK